MASDANTEGLLGVATEIDRLRQRVAELEKDRDKPWSYTIDVHSLKWEDWSRYDCELIDTGHSDRVRLLSCPDVNELLERCRQAESDRDVLGAEVEWRRFHNGESKQPVRGSQQDDLDALYAAKRATDTSGALGRCREKRT